VKVSTKLALDAALALFFLFSLGQWWSGLFLHEILGVLFFALYFTHLYLNFGYFKNIFFALRSFKALFKSFVILLLFLATLIFLISGVYNSKHAFSFLGFSSSMGVRKIHSTSAYWALILTGVHIGLEWRKVIAKFEFLARHIVLYRCAKVFVILLSAFGVYASFVRDIGPKLFLGFSFDFWDKGFALFCLYNLSIMSLFAFITYLTFKIFDKYRKK
jgi:hypothetical protein